MLWVIGIFAPLFSVVERLPRLRLRPSPLFRRYFTTDVFYFLTNYLAGSSLTIAYIVAGSRLVEQTLGLPRLASVDLPLWVSALLALIAFDFGQYLAHYFLHRFDVLWEFHKIHHSSPTLDWLATFRSHLFEQTVRRLLGPALVILLGFPLKAILISTGIFLAWVMFTHSNTRINLRFLEPVLITPRLHRVHHMYKTSESNLGGVFTIWDQIRGKLVSVDSDDKSVFSNGEPTYPQSWLVQFVEPISRIVRVSKKRTATS
jgi:lathosterol oxidase